MTTLETLTESAKVAWREYREAAAVTERKFRSWCEAAAKLEEERFRLEVEDHKRRVESAAKQEGCL